MNIAAMMTSAREDWETPQDLFDQLNAEFHFDLDAAASSENAKCERFFTKADDALLQEWKGSVFCNPPYSKLLGKWVEKAFDEWDKGNADTVVMLIPARTDTKWFHKYVWGMVEAELAEVRFIEGRLRFKGAEHNAPFPSMIVIWR
jgi:site-specific DNA-methyltransferase (adenine-specific)